MALNRCDSVCCCCSGLPSLRPSLAHCPDLRRAARVPRHPQPRPMQVSGRPSPGSTQVRPGSVSGGPSRILLARSPVQDSEPCGPGPAPAQSRSRGRPRAGSPARGKRGATYHDNGRHLVTARLDPSRYEFLLRAGSARGADPRLLADDADCGGRTGPSTWFGNSDHGSCRRVLPGGENRPVGFPARVRARCAALRRSGPRTCTRTQWWVGGPGVEGGPGVFERGPRNSAESAF